MKNINYYDSPIGLLRIVEEDGFVTTLTLHDDEPMPKEPYRETATVLTALVVKQLNEYFAGSRQQFDLPLKPKGTPFQQKDWAALQDIPYGEIRTYKQIAEAIDCPKGYRAVGLANNKNPIMIIIPCHRVIGANKKLVGYAGGLHIKEYLLKLEGCNWEK